MANKLTDKDLQEKLKWSDDNVAELDDITSGRVTRGAFARIAGLKMKLEAAHHALIKDVPQVAAPVVIMLVGMEDEKPTVRQIGMVETVEGEIVPEPRQIDTVRPVDVVLSENDENTQEYANRTEPPKEDSDPPRGNV